MVQTCRGYKGESTYDANAKIWYGPKHELKYPPESSLGQVLLDELLENPERIAQISCDNGTEYTNGQIADMALKVACHFKKFDLEQGTVLGFCGGNTDNVAPFVIGAFLNGLILSTFDPNIGKDGIKYMYSITKPSLMFCDGSIYEEVKSSLKEINLNILIYTMNDHLSGVPEFTEFLQESASKEIFKTNPLKLGYLQTAVILCSSGTTGPQKCICVSHGIFLNSFLEELFKQSDRTLNFSSLYWISGFIFLICSILAGSTRLITKYSFTAERFLHILEKYKATFVMAPPAYMIQIANSPRIKTADLRSLETCLTGGSPVTPAIVSKVSPFLSNDQIFVAYGLSEYPLIFLTTGLVSEDGSCGILRANTELKIVNDKGDSLGPNENGEIMVKTVLPFNGYFENTLATADLYKNGWMSTGDIGYMNDKMSLFVIDRKKDIIFYKNDKFYPTEIEEILLEIPEISEACVAGVPSYNAKLMPAIALIVVKPGCSLNEPYIYKYVSNRIAKFEIMEGGIHFVKIIPKTVSGKNLRRKLQNFIMGNSISN